LTGHRPSAKAGGSCGLVGVPFLPLILCGSMA